MTRYNGSDITINETIFGQPIAGEGIVAFPYQGLFPGGVNGVFHQGLDVLDAQSGKLLWQKAIGLTMSGPGGNESSAVVNGVLYVIGTFPDNSVDAVTSLYAFDAHTGTLRWSIPDSDFNGSLLVNDNVLYSVYNRGDVNALNVLAFTPLACAASDRARFRGPTRSDQ